MNRCAVQFEIHTTSYHITILVKYTSDVALYSLPSHEISVIYLTAVKIPYLTQQKSHTFVSLFTLQKYVVRACG
jgi:hypothetical protein